MVLAMSEKRTKITIPPELDAEMTPAVRAFVEVLLARIESLETEVSELKRLIGRNPQNSSVPPSSEHPHAKQPVPKREPSGRKRGGQKGHKKHQRTLVPPEQVTVIETCRQQNRDVFAFVTNACSTINASTGSEIHSSNSDISRPP